MIGKNVATIVAILSVVALAGSSMCLFAFNPEDVDPSQNIIADSPYDADSDIDNTILVYNQYDFTHDSETGPLYMENRTIYKLMANVELDYQLQTRTNTFSVLDLNGFALSSKVSSQGIKLNQCSELVIEDSSGTNQGSIEHSTDEEGNRIAGTGIYVYRATLYFESGTIKNNSANGTGGGLYLESGVVSNVTYGYARIKGTISNNSSTGNGAGIHVKSGELELTESAVISDNSSGASGGGIYSNSKMIVNGAKICNNSATSSGGGVYSNSKMIVNGAKICNNSATSSGGGIFANNIIILEGNTLIDGNTAKDGAGVYANSTITETMTLNVTGEDAQYDATFVMKGNVVISDNEASKCGGGLYVKGTVFILNGTISNNIANTGSNGSNKCGGGGVYAIAGSSFTMSNGRVTGNISDTSDSKTNACGGGVMCYGKFALSGGEVDHNNAYDGGGVWAFDWVVGENAEIHDNSAFLGGAMYINEKDGTRLGTGTMYGGKIYNNSATSAGGGIFVHGYAYIYGGDIYNNTAGWAGGGIMSWPRSSSSATSLTGSIIHMYGGSIRDNTLTCTGSTTYSAAKGYYGGAGICVLDAFYMYGGSITGNSIDTSKVPDLVDNGDGTYTGTHDLNYPILGSGISIHYATVAGCTTTVELIDGTISGNSGGFVEICAKGVLKLEKTKVTGLIYVGPNGYMYNSGHSSPVVVTNLVVSDTSKQKTGTYTSVFSNSSTHVMLELAHYLNPVTTSTDWIGSVMVPFGKIGSATINSIIDYGHTIPLESDSTTWYTDNSWETTVNCDDMISSLVSKKGDIARIFTYGTTRFTVTYELNEDLVGYPPEAQKLTISSAKCTFVVSGNKVDGHDIFGAGSYTLVFDENGNIVLQFESEIVLNGWYVNGITGAYLKCNTEYNIVLGSDGIYRITDTDDALVMTLTEEPNITLTPYISQYTIYYVIGEGQIIEELHYSEIDTVYITTESYSREGYIFAGWNHTVEGITNHYAQGGVIHNAESGDIYLYAVWITSSHTSTITIPISF